MSAERHDIECFECGTVQSGHAFDDCARCGSDNTAKVIITPCPFGDNANNECHDPYHHYGRGDHVETVEE